MLTVTANINHNTNLTELELLFKRDELVSYTEHRKTGLSDKSINWLEKASQHFWLHTSGTVCKESLDILRQYAWNKYCSDWSKDKVLRFATSFLQYLTKTHLDSRCVAFKIFLARPKALKERNVMTSRIITKHDIQNCLSYIENTRLEGLISRSKAQQY